MPSSELSKAHSMLSAMERLNSDQSAPFRRFLDAVIASPADHQRFLNMLSMLEHIGSRKIMLTQMKGILTQDILKHLAEETRHAFFFKREAEKLSGRPLEGYGPDETMCAASGQIYFGRLDSGLTGDLAADHPETGYLWVSLIVELRAIWVYRLYHQALVDAAYPLPLKGIIAEEDRHLLDMVDRLAELGFDTDAALPSAIALERTLFARLFARLEESIPATEAA